MIVQLASILHDTDYAASGRNVERLGLAGLSVKQIRHMVSGVARSRTPRGG